MNFINFWNCNLFSWHFFRCSFGSRGPSCTSCFKATSPQPWLWCCPGSVSGWTPGQSLPEPPCQSPPCWPWLPSPARSTASCQRHYWCPLIQNPCHFNVSFILFFPFHGTFVTFRFISTSWSVSYENFTLSSCFSIKVANARHHCNGHSNNKCLSFIFNFFQGVLCFSKSEISRFDVKCFFLLSQRFGHHGNKIWNNWKNVEMNCN